MGCEASQSANLLVVDSDTIKSRALRYSLAAQGYVIAEAGSGGQALQRILQKPADLIVLDAEALGTGVVETCRRLRFTAPHTGIVVVAVCDSEEEKVQALDAGADDYITKPFSFHVFLARLHALTRRLGGGGAVIKTGDLELDLGRRILLRSNVLVDLSPTEFVLLSYFMQHADTAIEHRRLLDAVWGSANTSDLDHLRTYVRRLRKKIEKDPSNPKYLVTVPGLGYRLCHRPRFVFSGAAARSSSQQLIDIPLKKSSAAAAMDIADMSLRRLRAAIQKGEISFPSQVPMFNRQSRADIQWRLAGLYFVRNWSCTSLGERHGVTMERVRQMLSKWVRRAICLGYLQEIPAADPPITIRAAPQAAPE
jgi:two-component system, OmpR family, KDP operon response regulator KdpE